MNTSGKYGALNELFDIIKVKGFRLSSEDKRLYYLQVESKEVVYSQAQLASKKSIQPSKRQKLQTDLPSTSRDFAFDCHALSSSESENSEYNEEEDSIPKPTRKYNSSKLAAELVISTGVSTNKASNIFKHLTDSGLATPSLSQSAIFKATFKEAVKLKEQMKENLQMENWSLHFDGKHIQENEYQVVVLKNKRTEVKLDALRLKDGKADTGTFAQAITKVIDEYNLVNAIKMITADTTSVNTGKKNAVAIQLQQRL